MKFRLSLLFLICLSFSAFGQFTDDFSSGMINTTVWSGDLENFTVNSNQELQLLDTATVLPSSQIFTAVNTGDSTNWEFYYKQDFSASTSNFSKIYLASSAADLNGDLNGYFIKLGGISGDADRIELYRQTDSDTELLISGQDSMLAKEPSEGRIRVSRNNDGLWTLMADYTGGNSFEIQGTAMDDTHRFGSYFGIVCKYTSSRFDKFSFDDISIDPLFVDNIPPIVDRLTALDELHIHLLFNEPVDKTSAELASNYVLNPSIGIAMAVQDPVNEAAVLLTLSAPLISEENYDLEVKNIKDKSNNAQASQVLSFIFLKEEGAEPYDILINEIHADPEPAIGLPSSEYLELYNKSDKIINLRDFSLADNNAEIVLPEKLLFPKEYLIVYKTGNADFSAFGDSLPLPDFFTLGNSFDDLVLYNPDGDIIHSVFYQKSWYGDSDKSDGGFSLELINPRDPCTFRNNWIASTSPVGGTPGQQNAVLEESSNLDDLDVLLVYPLFGATEIEVTFNKSLDLTNATDLNNYEIEGLSILKAEVQPQLFNRVILTLADQLLPQTIYTLEIKTSLSDCKGSPVSEEIIAPFGLPEVYDPLDIVINEVLFNPQTGGVDFVELYNRSEKIIDISNLLIANRDTNKQIDKVVPVSNNFLLLPDQYVVLTSDPEDIKSRYDVENPKAMVSVDLPTYPDKEGTVVLYYTKGAQSIFIDEFSYQQDYHNPLLDVKDGSSLERISPENLTQDPDNWHTAAASAGLATPTYLNSQYSVEVANGTELIILPYTTFSPDSDGFRDFLSIQYQTPQSGFLANVKIFDTKGREVQTLTRNELLGTNGILQWDGTTAEGRKARIGIYLLWIELFHPDGQVESFRKNCVLAGQLN